MKISAIACNYNGGEFVGDAVESVLANFDSNLEIVVVDDGSTDNSREILSRYKGNPRVNIVLQENSGQPGAFNSGIAAAQGDVLCIFDGDDFWFPHKTRALREAISHLGLGAEPWLMRHPLLNLFEHDQHARPNEKLCYYNLKGAQPIKLGEMKHTLSPQNAIEHIANDGFGIYGGGNFGGSSVMSRAMAEKVFPLPLLSKFYGDMMPLFSGPIVGNFYVTARYLGAYRFHGTNHSLTRKLEPLALWLGMTDYLNRILEAEGSNIRADFCKTLIARPYLIAEGRKSDALSFAKKRFEKDKNLKELIKTYLLIAKPN